MPAASDWMALNWPWFGDGAEAGEGECCGPVLGLKVGEARSVRAQRGGRSLRARRQECGSADVVIFIMVVAAVMRWVQPALNIHGGA